MANQWFKIYGIEMLADPKIQRLTASERSCWLTILCLASLDDGVINNCEEEYLMKHSGIDPMSQSWTSTRGILTKFEMLGMITIDRFTIYVTNWEKRQKNTAMTGYERLKKWREKKRLEANDNAMITHDNGKNRIEENRIEEREIHTSVSYLENIPEKDIENMKEKYGFSESFIKDKADSLLLYCQSKGRKYKNYRAFLINALKKDYVPAKKGITGKLNK